MKKKFAKQIFISYVHSDNWQLSPEQMGCITRLQHKLNALPSAMLGRIIEISRYNNLLGNDVFAEEIVQQFK